MKYLILTAAACFSLAMQVAAQTSYPGPTIVCPYEIDYPGTATYVPPLSGVSSKTAIIDVVYDQTFQNNPQAMAAFAYAVDIWESQLIATQPISIKVRFGSFSNQTLANTRIVTVYDFTTLGSNVIMVSSLANQKFGADGNADSSDFEIVFNSALLTGLTSGSNTYYWYFGTDAQPSTTQFDFVSTALHEIAHGLGIYSYARIANNGTGNWDNNGQFPVPGIYDTKIKNSSGIILTNVANNSTTLANYLQSDDLYWDGYNGYVGNGYVSPKVFAPNTFSPGSSISHLDESTFPRGNINSLLTPERQNGEAIHNPGPIIRGMLKDIGWDVEYIVGLEDYITIGTYPQSVYAGQIVNTTATFTDVSPSTSVITYFRKLELYHQSGLYTLYSKSKSGAYGGSWTDTIPTLPSGYQWLRNYDGSIKARITVSCLDSDSYTHDDWKYTKYYTVPDKPYMAVNYLIDHQAKIDIFASGADEYKIYYDTVKGQPYTGNHLTPSGTPIVLTDRNYILVDDFVPRKYYYFNSKGTNYYGTGAYSDSVVFCIYKPNYKVTVVSGSPVNGANLKMLDESLSPNDGSEYQVKIIDSEDNVTIYGGEGYIPANFPLNNMGEFLTLKEGDPVYWRNNATYILRLTYKLCGIERLEQVNFSLTAGVYGSSKNDITETASTALESNDNGNNINIYPNPFTSSFTIKFTNPTGSVVALEIFDMAGRKVSIVNKPEKTTEHHLNFDNVPSGTYIVKAKDVQGKINFFQRIVKLE